MAGAFGDDDVSGGPGDDFVTGDLPFGDEDPSPNFDTCSGGPGVNDVIFCEA